MVGFYTLNPRSFVIIEVGGKSVESPLYGGLNGAICGYARLCAPGSILMEHLSCNAQPGAMLLPQYEGHPDDFYMDLQAFHDDCEYWRATEAGNELTELGLARYKHLCEIYSEE